MTPADKSALPTGSVTFLFTDIGGSTRLFRQTGDRWPALLARHDALLTDAFKASGGHVLSHDGDGYFVAFSSIDDAVKATVQAQRSLADEPWPDDAVIKVRAGITPATPSPVTAATSNGRPSSSPRGSVSVIGWRTPSS